MFSQTSAVSHHIHNLFGGHFQGQATTSYVPDFGLFYSIFRISICRNFHIHFTPKYMDDSTLFCHHRFVTINFIKFLSYFICLSSKTLLPFFCMHFFSVFLWHTIAVAYSLYEKMWDEKKRSSNTASPVYQPTTIPQEQLNMLSQNTAQQQPASTVQPQNSTNTEGAQHSKLSV